MFRILAAIAALLFIFASSSHATPAKQICHMGKRELRAEVVVADTPSKLPCKVLVTKSEEDFSKEHVPWNAQGDLSYCETKFQSYIEKLTSIGWKCDAASTEPQAAPVAVEENRATTPPAPPPPEPTPAPATSEAPSEKKFVRLRHIELMTGGLTRAGGGTNASTLFGISWAPKFLTWKRWTLGGRVDFTRTKAVDGGSIEVITEAGVVQYQLTPRFDAELSAGLGHWLQKNNGKNFFGPAFGVGYSPEHGGLFGNVTLSRIFLRVTAIQTPVRYTAWLAGINLGF